MSLKNLNAYQPRQFVGQKADLTDAKQVVDYYEQLENRPVSNSADLERWLLDRSELDAALSEVGSILYIEMTCQTDDKAKAGAYSDFIQTVPPAIKPINDRLNKRYLELKDKYPLDPKRYFVYNRAIEEDIALFKLENVPLQTQIDVLSQEYQTISAAMTVSFKGKERTLPEMGTFLLETDRSLRQEAWSHSAKRRLVDKDKLESLFEQMFELRNKVAKQAGCAHFIEYQFKAYHRFDYTADDCKRYHESMEQLVVPLYGKILERRRNDMALTTLKPWDLAVDPQGKSALKPFVKVEDLIVKTGNIFKKLDPQLSQEFESMRQLDLLDLASRKGKAPGGYQNTLSESRKPFIFMNAVGVDDDVRTLLHEAGHAFHALASSSDPLIDYRHAPMEFCEVASMAMELLGGQYINEFYSPDDAKRSMREHLEGIIQTLAWVANIDAFQHWLYEHPNHRAPERRQAWLGFYEHFGGKFVDWSDLLEVKGYLWHRQLHIFEVPFYYIEYGIAQLGALHVWLKSKKDPVQALADYRRALSLGGSRPLPELYQAAGIQFNFSPEIIKPLVEAVAMELERLD